MGELESLYICCAPGWVEWEGAKMEPEPSFWQQLGVSLPDMMAGFWGGVTKAALSGDPKPWPIISTVLVGALTANYLSPVIGHYIGTTGGVTGYVTGLTGMLVCQSIINAAQGWRPFQPKGGDDA